MSSQNLQPNNHNIETIASLDNLKDYDSDTLNAIICTVQYIILKGYGIHKSNQFADDYKYILRQNGNNMQQTFIELIKKYRGYILNNPEKIKRG